MKKIALLCTCITLLLLLGFADGNLQKKKTLQAFTTIAKEEGEENKEEEKEGIDRVQKERDIRVLIKTADFSSEYHSEITVAAANGFSVFDGNLPDTCLYEAVPGESVVFAAEGGLYADKSILRLDAAESGFEIAGLNRAGENIRYAGTLEIRRTQQGLLLINELPLEEYLCGVVPSEMPASYPEEALKAQAVCARTYAKKRMEQESAAAFFADVDDSVSYQVYNNQERTQETDRAVAQTEGLVLTKDGELIDALYYSTSCGLDLHMDLSKEAVFAAFLQEDHISACEAGEPWYRWQTDVILAELGTVSKLRIDERGESGVVSRLAVLQEDGQEMIYEGEYEIRRFLAQAAFAVTLQDGETIEGMSLLPSAFFILQPLYDNEILYGYHILGGGYGHGIGMSQNGAKQMALAGSDFQDILHNYYTDAEIETKFV